MDTDKKKKINECLKLFDEEKYAVEAWLSTVRTQLENYMKKPGSRVHYIRWRIKDAEHLKAKLERKWEDEDDRIGYKKKLQGKNVFDVITDLAGVRILVLYRDDIPVVDERIWDNITWRIEECTAWYDQWRENDLIWNREHCFYDKEWYDKNGFDETDELPQILNLKPTTRGYSSYHYILKSKDEDPRQTCELQLRTIHQDAWGEFDHELIYPHEYIDPLPKNLVVRLSNLLNVAEDIVREIRRSPTDALLARHLLRVHEQPGRTTAKKQFREIVNVFLDKAPHLARSAPLAALWLLTNDSKKMGGPNERVITLDFGRREDWDTKYSKSSDKKPKLHDPLRKQYLKAHEYWKSKALAGGAGAREVRKYFVWDKKDIDIDTDDLIDLFQNRMDFVVIPKDFFTRVHNILEKHAPALRLRRVQFFVWDMPDPEPASVAYGPDVFGFYSPATTPDLTGGIVQLHSKNSKQFKILNAYVDLLDYFFEEEVVHKIPCTSGDFVKNLGDKELEVAVLRYFNSFIIVNK